MIFTDAARELLKTLEALRLTAYRDQGKKRGRWTIGYGHTGPEVVEGLVWTQDQAEMQLLEDIDSRAGAVDHLLQHAATPISDNQFSALVIFVFNEGITAFIQSHLLAQVLRGNLALVPHELQKWVYEHDASGVPFVCEGLVNRRAAEIALWSQT